MQIEINGSPTVVEDGISAAQLVEQLGLAGKRIAMEINREIVPRSEYATMILKDGDEVEVVHAIGGGQLPAVSAPVANAL